MKKTLSIFLVAAMLLCMAPVFGIFAAEDDFTTIDSAEEFAAFTAAINAGTHIPTGTVLVTADLDMEGIDYKPINQLNGFILDFDGHTVENINLNVTAADCYNNWHGNFVGLIANYVGNAWGINNLELKNSSITVDAAVNVDVGGVAGTTDRGYVLNTNLDNVKITSNAGGNVGGLVGCFMWDYGKQVSYDTTLNMEVVAPKANVGLIGGHINDAQCKVSVMRIKGTVSIPDAQAANAVAPDTIFGNGTIARLDVNTGLAGLFVSESGLQVKITGNEAALEQAEKLKEIDNGEELALLAQVQREQGANYRSGEVIKVNADLDMTGIEYLPMVDMCFELDFQGHTVKNLTVSVTTDNMAQFAAGTNTAVGLIACSMTNGGGAAGCVSNIKLRDCKIEINVPMNVALRVGGVVGYTNRGFVKSVEMRNVEINVTGGAPTNTVIGAVAGQYQWEYNVAGQTTDVESTRLLSVSIIAPTAANVGLLYGNVSDGAKVNLNGVVIDNMTVVCNGGITADRYAALNGAAVTIAEGFAADESNSAEATDNGVIVNVMVTDGTVPAGDAAMVAAIAVAVVALVGMAVFFKKRIAC